MSETRAAIWAALSTQEQNRGDDKTSMRDQLERCRKAISDKGWTLATTYQSIGSRTKAVEISVIRAENQVFDAMINDAEKGLYDVLVMVDYDRLRDMLAPVSRVLESFGAQLYSLNQPHDIQPPAQFDPYFNETGEMNRMLSSSIQRMKTNQLRRDYFTKMPRRVTERGLAPSKLPYGYRKP